MQTRSFLYIDECLMGVRRLMDSDFSGPVNIGSSEMISIDGLVTMVAQVAGKNIRIRHISGPLGVRGRTSDNRLIRERLGWAPSKPLREGIERTYAWIALQVGESKVKSGV
jgi:GDP-D-mannose 3',5'-epimerase